MEYTEKAQKKISLKELMLMRTEESQEMMDNNTDICTMISDVLREACIIPGFYGYSFMREAIIICIRDRKKPVQLCKNVYPEIAKNYYSTVSSVEHSIRKTVIQSWELTGNDFKVKYFGAFGLIGGRKPTPKEFIVTLAEDIEREFIRKCKSAVTA